MYYCKCLVNINSKFVCMFKVKISELSKNDTVKLPYLNSYRCVASCYDGKSQKTS